MNKKIIPAAVIIWLITILTVVFVTINQLPYTPTFPYAQDLLPQFGPRLLTTWAQFDGVHYLTIITKGYHAADLIQAFFPGYPLLVNLASLNNHINPLIIGLYISLSSFILSLYFLYQLILLDKSISANKIIIALLLFPTSFFFIAFYTESFFFLCVILSFYLARKRRWALAGIFGALASFTRLTGIFLIPALIYEWLSQKPTKRSHLDFVYTFIPAIGLGIYMLYLWQQFSDPLLFVHVQSQFGVARTTNQLILWPQVVYRYLKILLTLQPNIHSYLITLQELAAGTLGFFALIVAWFKVRRSYVIFALLSFFLPTLTGTFTSLPRYLLVLFPIYFVIAKLPKKSYLLTLFVFAILFFVNIVFFTQGLWVA